MSGTKVSLPLQATEYTWLKHQSSSNNSQKNAAFDHPHRGIRKRLNMTPFYVN